MLPIYSECKFGIDDSINSIVEESLERLKLEEHSLLRWITRMNSIRYLSYFPSQSFSSEISSFLHSDIFGFACTIKML